VVAAQATSKKGVKNMLKQFGLVVTDATGKIGDRWDQGSTEVNLRARAQPPVTGDWEARSPSDIDDLYTLVVGAKELAPRIQRSYDYHTARKILYLRVSSENTEDEIEGGQLRRRVPLTTVLAANDFNIANPYTTSGKGHFYWERKTFAVNWHVDRVVEGIASTPAAVPPKNKVALGRWYRLEPNDPALIKRTTQGFQEYEFFSDRQECLYVGRSGGKDGKDPSSWVDRLTKDHIATDWILEAKTVVVLYGLTLPESMAEEEFRIRGGNGRANLQQGDFSRSMPQGDLASNAQAAERHGYREKFRLVLLSNK
jgi:hypothetical protein